MGYYATSELRRKGDVHPENCVWEFFCDAQKSRLENRCNPLKTSQGNAHSPTKLASGRTYWPSRDPLGENFSTEEFNEYAFITNSPSLYIDYLGLFKIRSIDDPRYLKIVAEALGKQAPKTISPGGATAVATAAVANLANSLTESNSTEEKEKENNCCSDRNPTWENCGSGSATPEDAVRKFAKSLSPWEISAGGEALAELKGRRGELKHPDACKNGGFWTSVYTAFIVQTHTGIYQHKMSISVICCNCCRGKRPTDLESLSCRVIHGGRGSGEQPMPKPEPPYQNFPPRTGL